MEPKNSRIKRDGEHWVWTGARAIMSRPDTGLFMLHGKRLLVRRHLWVLAINSGAALPELDPGRQLRRTCDKPGCVRPDHQRMGPGPKKRRIKSVRTAGGAPPVVLCKRGHLLSRNKKSRCMECEAERQKRRLA